MPYSWSVNNVVADENMHTALALWQGGHPDAAYAIAKGSLLASMYMGITPGNVGTMNLLDVYRRESQRDFADSAGTMSRTIIESLFGVHPDSLAGTITISPGFPADWAHARLTHPDLRLSFVRVGHTDTWQIDQSSNHFRTLTLKVPAAFTGVQSVKVNGKSIRWLVDPKAVGWPVLKLVVKTSASNKIEIDWTGEPMSANWMSRAKYGKRVRDFQQRVEAPTPGGALFPKKRSALRCYRVTPIGQSRKLVVLGSC